MPQFSLNLTLDSHPQNIAEIEPFVVKALQEYAVDEEFFGTILTTLTEAVTNAILHGNRARPTKKVYVSTQCAAQTLSFTIRDEGNGFNPDAVPDPTTPENLSQEGGRGVFLMRQLCDKVLFSENGCVVELQFAI